MILPLVLLFGYIFGSLYGTFLGAFSGFFMAFLGVFVFSMFGLTKRPFGPVFFFFFFLRGGLLKQIQVYVLWFSCFTQ